jgi:hypothetical protein
MVLSMYVSRISVIEAYPEWMSFLRPVIVEFMMNSFLSSERLKPTKWFSLNALMFKSTTYFFFLAMASHLAY